MLTLKTPQASRHADKIPYPESSALYLAVLEIGIGAAGSQTMR